MRAVLSPDAMTMCFPSGLNAAELTELWWPPRIAICLAVAYNRFYSLWLTSRPNDLCALVKQGADDLGEHRDLLTGDGGAVFAGLLGAIVDEGIGRFKRGRILRPLSSASDCACIVSGCTFS
jgi:hypothetical protein